MYSLPLIQQLLKNNPTDIRMEVVIADLIREGLDLERMIFITNSLFKRNFHFDIEEIVETEYAATGKKKLSLVVNRPGLYDHIPEDLFHQPLDMLDGTDTAGSIREIKVQDEIETQSRLFFRPVEQEFYRQRLLLEMEERQFLFETTDHVQNGIFDELWSFPEILDAEQKTKLGFLMPVLHRISGNIPLITSVMHQITGDNITFVETTPLDTEISSFFVLGEQLLGVNSTLGGSLSSMQTGYILQLIMPSASALPDFLPGGKKRLILEYLCDLLIPLDTDIAIEIHLKHEGPLFSLDESGHAGILNYSTTI